MMKRHSTRPPGTSEALVHAMLLRLIAQALETNDPAKVLRDTAKALEESGLYQVSIHA